jgi:hypothetical protein
MTATFVETWRTLIAVSDGRRPALYRVCRLSRSDYSTSARRGTTLDRAPDVNQPPPRTWLRHCLRRVQSQLKRLQPLHKAKLSQ